MQHKSIFLILLLLTLTACGGGGESDGNTNNPTPNPDTGSGGGQTGTSKNSILAARSVFAAPSDNCPAGGVEIELGVDTNANGVLDNDEVQKTEILCHGTDGLNGTDGIKGTDGLNALISLINLDSYETCQASAVQINAGLDTNLNAQLDEAEITATNVICSSSETATQTSPLSSKGKVTGKVPTAAFKVKTAAGSVKGAPQFTSVTDQDGELWLTTDDILGAINGDKDATDQSKQDVTEEEISAPLVQPLKVDVDSEGNFEVEAPIGTNYSLILISADGKTGINLNDILVSSAGVTEVNISEDELQATGNATLKVASFRSNAALANAKVTLLETGTEILTDGQGEVLIEDLAPGQYRVMIEAEGFITKNLPFTVNSEQTTEIGIIELNNQKGSAVGQVIAEGLESNINIIVYARGNDGSIFTTLTDTNGNYKFNSLPVGQGYSFIAQANDFESSKQDNIDVVFGETSSVNQITLKRIKVAQGSITGFAKFSEFLTTQNKHAGIIVSVEGTDKEAITSRDGAFVINGLIPGSYTLNYTDSNHKTITITDVNVVDATFTNLETQVLESITGSLTGFIKNSQGNAISGVNVLIEELGIATLTNDQGQFNLNNVPAGLFTLSVQKSGYTGFKTQITVKPNAEVALGDFNIDAFALTGRIEIAGLEDLSGTSVSLLNTQFTALTDAQGQFTISGIPAGEYQLQVTLAGYQTQVFTVSVSEQAPTFTFADPISLIQFKIGGTVNLNTSSDNSNVIITVEGKNVTASSNAQGDFVLTGLTAGTHTLVLQKEGYQSKSVVVELSEQSPVLALESNITLEQYVIKGFAKLASATDHSGITISLEGTTVSALTAADGSFSLTDVKPGTYKLIAAKTAFTSQESFVSLFPDVPSTELPFSIELTPAIGLINGLVTLENQIAHGGVEVSLVGTSFTTQTDNLGNWSLEVPIGNYDQGIQYSKNLYRSVLDANTVTVIEQGQFRPAVQTLIQSHIQLSLPVTTSASCSAVTLKVEGSTITGQSYSTQVNVENGLAQLNIPFGEYRAEVSCADAGFETRVVNLNITKAGNGELVYNLDAIELRQRYLTINQDATYTNSSAITLQIGATEVSQMRISGDTTDSGWVAYQETYSTTLNAGDGVKNISVSFRDNNGVEVGAVTDSIELDTQVTVSRFEISGAATKGDTLQFVVDLNNDLNAQVKVTLSGLVSDYQLFDDGFHNDGAANDGVYGASYLVNTSSELALQATATIVDKANNTANAQSNTLNLVTAPSIENFSQSSNIASQTMQLAFDTDEATTAVVNYGNAPDALTNNVIISALASIRHTVELSNLSISELTYFQIIVTDEAGNTSNKTGQGKLAPDVVTGLLTQAGDREIGFVWEPDANPYTEGYRVYRSEDNASFTLVNPDALILGSYYQDTNVNNNQAYYYKVSAVDRYGNESLHSKIVSDTAQASFAGPTTITEDELFGEHIWLSSKSPYIINKNVSLRMQGRIRMLPGTRLLLDSTVQEVHLASSDVSHFWGFGEENNRIVIEQVGSNTAWVSLAALKDHDQVYSSYKLNNSDSWTKDNYPLSGDYIRYLETNGQDRVFNFHSSSNLVLFKPKLNTNFRAGMILEGEINLEGETGYCTLMEKSTVTISGGDNNGGGLGGCHLSHTKVTSDGSGRISDSSSFNASIENVTVRGVTLKNSRLKDIKSEITSKYHGNQFFRNVFEFSTGSVCDILETSQYAIEAREIIQSNIWLDQSLALIKECGAIDLYRFIPFLTSEAITKDSDGDGVPDTYDHDNDNDGYSDYQELKLSDQFDPFDSNSKPDSSIMSDNDMDGTIDSEDTDDDNDGLSDDEELALGTSPFMQDTDLDGVTDYYEFVHGFNPLNKENMPLTGLHSGINISNGQFKNQVGIIKVIYQDINEQTYFINEGWNSNNWFKWALNCFACSIDAGSTLSIDESARYSTIFNYLTAEFQIGNPIIFTKTTSPADINNSVLVNVNARDISYLRLHNSSLYYGDGNFELRQSTAKQSILNILGIEDSLIEESVVRNSSIRAGRTQFYKSKLIDILFDQPQSLPTIFRNVAISGGNTWGTVYDSLIENSGGRYNAMRSDVIIDDSTKINGLPNFYNQSYLKIDKTVIDNEGSPIDRLGDGVIDTQISYTDLNDVVQSILVDGIAAPRTTPYFRNGADSVVILNHVGNQ
jgi:hypothetical protein